MRAEPSRCVHALFIRPHSVVDPDGLNPGDPMLRRRGQTRRLTRHLMPSSLISNPTFEYCCSFILSVTSKRIGVRKNA